MKARELHWKSYTYNEKVKIPETEEERKKSVIEFWDKLEKKRFECRRSWYIMFLEALISGVKDKKYRKRVKNHIEELNKLEYGKDYI